MDIVEQAATGRVLEYDPATKTTRIVASGLSFPNGIALSEDESDLLVAETGRFRGTPSVASGGKLARNDWSFLYLRSLCILSVVMENAPDSFICDLVLANDP